MIVLSSLFINSGIVLLCIIENTTFVISMYNLCVAYVYAIWQKANACDSTEKMTKCTLLRTAFYLLTFLFSTKNK